MWAAVAWHTNMRNRTGFVCVPCNGEHSLVSSHPRAVPTVTTTLFGGKTGGSELDLGSPILNLALPSSKFNITKTYFQIPSTCLSLAKYRCGIAKFWSHIHPAYNLVCSILDWVFHHRPRPKEAWNERSPQNSRMKRDPRLLWVALFRMTVAACCCFFKPRTYLLNAMFWEPLAHWMCQVYSLSLCFSWEKPRSSTF